MEVPLSLIALLILIPLSSFFAGSEIAVFSITRLHLKRLIAEGKRNVTALSDLHQNPESTLSSILLGNTLVNVVASFFAALLTLRLAKRLGISGETSTTIAILGMTLLLLIFGEFAPKLYAAQRKEGFALRVAPLLKGICQLFSPVLFLLHIFLRPFRTLRGESESIHRSVDELKTMLEIGLESQVLSKEDAKMIRKVFDLSETQIKQVMTPRVKVVALPSSSTVKDAVSLIQANPYSRIPVYQESFDHIIGILYVRDLLPHLKKPDLEISLFVRPSYHVPETMGIGEFFTGLEKNSSHIGIVVDEYGGTSGLVTLDDLLEEVVGEILEEEDRMEPPLVSSLGEGEAKVLGSIDLHHLNELLNTDLPTEFAVTLGGFLYDLAGKIPGEGEIYRYESVTFTIEEVVERRIVRVKVNKTGK
jgi:CBS domain containing-hemolysin-like protein